MTSTTPQAGIPRISVTCSPLPVISAGRLARHAVTSEPSLAAISANAVGRKRAGIGLGQQTQGSGGVRRATAKSSCDRQGLGQAEAAERDASSLGLGGLRRSNDEIVALKRAGERSIHGKREVLTGLKLEAVAKVGEANEAAHLVVAIGAAAEHLKGEVELGFGSVAERRHREPRKADRPQA